MDTIISAKDAAVLSLNKDRYGLPQKVFVSMIGQLTVLTEVIKQKNQQFFLVELDHCVNILIRESHLDWQRLLRPLHNYIFHNVRLTTIQKGACGTRSIYCVVDCSSYEEVSEENLKACCFQEWLKKQGLTDAIKVTELCQTDSSEANNKFSYQGTVTSNADAIDGIYILDDKIRLVTALHLTSDHLPKLEINDSVSVYNGHILKTGGTVTICCCIQSSIQVHKHAGALQPFISTLGIISPEIVKYSLNLQEVLTLIEIRKEFKQQWSGQKFIQFVQRYLNNELGCDQEASPTWLDLFLRHDELCSFMTSKSTSCRLPILIDLKIIAQQAVLTHRKESEDQRGDTDIENNQLSKQWNFSVQRWEHNHVLIGYISKSDFGYARFKTKSHSMPLLVMEPHVEQDLNGPPSVQPSERLGQTKSEGCTGKHKSLAECGFQFSSFVLDPCVLNKQVLVTQFEVTVESMSVKSTSEKREKDVYTGEDSCEAESKNHIGDESREVELSQHGVCSYLSFSLKDCFLLEEIFENQKERPEKPSKLLPLSRPLQRQDSFPWRLCQADKTSCFLYICEKLPVIDESFRDRNGNCVSFRIIGYLLRPDYLSALGKKCQHLQEIPAQREEGKGKSVKKESISNSPATVSCPGIKTQSHSIPLGEKFCEKKLDINTDKVVGMKRNSAEQMGECSDTYLKAVSMCMRNTNVQWFSWLHPGLVYKLSTSKLEDNSFAFMPLFSNAKVQKVVEQHKARVEIEVPEDALVERVHSGSYLSLPDVFGVGLPQFSSITDVLSGRCKDPIVSIRGLIVDREYTDPQTAVLGDMKNIKLRVSSQLDDARMENIYDFDSISVYIDCAKAVYLLGLTPGCFVELVNLERKVSKAGLVYCRFMSVSSSQVVRLCRPSTSRRLKTYKRDALEKPISLGKDAILHSIWNEDSEASRGGSVWLIHCHICVFFKLSIKLVCSLCHGLFTHAGCQSRGCGSKGVAKTVASAVVLVEDGTGQASVKVWGEKQVRKLLTLSEVQWRDVLSVIKGSGELLLIKFGERVVSSELDSFMEMLTSSPMVIRPCVMVVKRARGSTGRACVDKMRLEDFEEKSVRIGQTTISTLSLPLLQLDCLDVQEENLS